MKGSVDLKYVILAMNSRDEAQI